MYSYSTPVLLLGKFHWKRSLEVPSTRGHKESDANDNWTCMQGRVAFSFSYYWKSKPSTHCGNITCTHSQILLYTNIVSGGLVLSSSGFLGDMSPIKAPTAGSPNWISFLHCISSPCTSLEHLLKLELSEYLCNCFLDPHLLHLILSLGKWGPETLFLLCCIPAPSIGPKSMNALLHFHGLEKHTDSISSITSQIPFQVMLCLLMFPFHLALWHHSRKLFCDTPRPSATKWMPCS